MLDEEVVGYHLKIAKELNAATPISQNVAFIESWVTVWNENSDSLLYAKHVLLELMWGEAIACTVYTLNNIKQKKVHNST